MFPCPPALLADSLWDLESSQFVSRLNKLQSGLREFRQRLLERLIELQIFCLPSTSFQVDQSFGPSAVNLQIGDPFSM